MIRRFVLDRYVLREWFKILLFTEIGFPVIVTAFELTDSLNDVLSRGVPPTAVALGYLYSMPEKVFLVLPAAVLFATVFTLSALSRNAELTAAKASGRSFYRTVAPVFGAAALATVAAYALGEWAPLATRRQLELLGEREVRSTTQRYNFVYRADQGWVYSVWALDLNQNRMRHAVLEREGTGPAYPTLVLQSPLAHYDSIASRWTLTNGRFRVLRGVADELTFSFDSLRARVLVEEPAELLIEPKQPKEMQYAELGRYIDDLERSGGDGRKLRVRQALKIAIPFTCLVIALFGAPLALSDPRASGAFGIGVSLVTTLVFLMLVQLAEGIGGGGLLPPAVAAWLPNAVFTAAGIGLLARAKT